MSCEECGKIYTNKYDKWCKPCQIKDLKGNFINWTSGNEKVDHFIQEKQLEINSSNDTVLEWIPYNQFFSIKEIEKDDFSTISLAKWRDGSLYWSEYDNKKYIRETNKEVTLKYLYNLQSIEGFLNAV